MSHVFNYRGQYFRIEVAEVVNADDLARPSFIAWASEAFRELAQTPKQACSRFIAGSSAGTRGEAIEHAQEWIRSRADAREAQEAQEVKSVPKSAGRVSVLYTVWVYKDGEPIGSDFENFWEAESFAEAAKKTVGVTKVGVKNNESPQYLTLWERPAK